jgi:hypothetical protein
MTLLELELPGMLREGTRAFVVENSRQLARALEPALPVIEREARALKGGDGLVIKKRFLEAREPWERFFWSRIAQHYVRDRKPLEDALKLADEDVLMLSSVLQPL